MDESSDTVKEVDALSSISGKARTTLQTFQQVKDAASTTPERLAAVDDNAGRFKLWAGNIGALHTGKLPGSEYLTLFARFAIAVTPLQRSRLPLEITTWSE